MLDSSDFIFEPYKDKRVINHPGFTVGMSGSLLIATHKKTGKKYIVKHTFPHNAANEYVACWLAEKINVPAPKAYLLSPDNAFASRYAVAIEFIDGLRSFSKKDTPDELKSDLIAQFAFYLMLRLDDTIQMGRTDDHIYSYDFSEGFNIVDLRYIIKSSDELMGFFLQSPLQNFKMYTQKENFDLAIIIAEELHMDYDELKNGMISTIRRATDITDDDLHALSEELMKMYPMAIAAYYEECIRAIRQKAQTL